jgi:hypothetical protein
MYRLRQLKPHQPPARLSARPSKALTLPPIEIPETEVVSLVLDNGTRMVEKRGFTPAVILSGVAVGIFQAFCPIVLWWLAAVDIWGVALAMIASVYVGFAVADGRRAVIAVEVMVAFAFVICATVAMALYPWLIVIGLLAHGLKDLWQHRTQFVNGTRWWPPFCLVVDVVAGALTAAVLLTGLDLHALVR